jgi:hypothetical protein
MSDAGESIPIQTEKVTVQDEPVTWRATLAGIFPIALIGLSGALLATPGESELSTALNMAGGLGLLPSYLLILAGMVIGWVRGFPRWCYPYIIYALLFAAYTTNASTPGLNFFGIPLFGRELWGWRAFVPVGTAALLALVITRFSLKTVARFFLGIWRDWTRLAFGFYGLLPFGVMASFDEVENAFEFPYMLLSLVLLVGGALFYMRTQGEIKPFLGLVVAAAITAFIVLTAGSVYWQTHDINLMGRIEPKAAQPDLKSAAIESIPTTGFILGILLSPVWIGLLRTLIDMLRQRMKRPSAPADPDGNAGG